MELWAEYDAMVPPPGCDCAKFKDYIEHFYQQRLLQFLSGLNDSYDQARRQILLKVTVPTFNQAYAMIVEDESQHSVGLNMSAEKADPMAMQMNRGQGYKGKRNVAYGNGNAVGQSGYRGPATYGGQPRNGRQPFAAVNMPPATWKIRHKHNTSLNGLTNDEWIVDSGSSHHVVSNKDLSEPGHFSQLHTSDKLHLPTGSKELYCGRVKGIGREKGGLYIFKKGLGSKEDTGHRIMAIAYKEDCNLWHKRLGHPSLLAMKYMKIPNDSADQEPDAVEHEYFIEDYAGGQNITSAEQELSPTNEQQLMTDTDTDPSVEELQVEDGEVMTSDQTTILKKSARTSKQPIG
ncbi:uncharacterized protein LOC142169703 [Nicotiana tabacum]|uniref:Uncharacterized protein LOC142169703 n=1 Tax=Nicotiana tabacum TaxID=4097 RepID=A0AC58SRW0_TOBAC